MSSIANIDLDLVCGGTRATYPNTCGRGAADGALAGVAGSASMLPFTALSGPSDAGSRRANTPAIRPHVGSTRSR